MPGPGQIYRDLNGRYALFVRTEDRGKGPEHLFAFVQKQMIFQRWSAVLPDGYELVNDTAGRTEASLAWAEVRALEYEKEALLKALKAAVAQLDDRVAREVRAIYSGVMEKAELKV